MIRLLRLLVGIALVGGSVVLASYAIYELVRTGTCGAPPGAVAVRACPDGTGADALLLVAAIFVIPFVGIGISPVARLLLGLLGWCFGWIGMGSAAFVAGHGPAAPPTAGDDATAVGITFLAIGGLSLLGLIVAGIVARRTSPDDDGRGDGTPRTGRRAKRRGATPPDPATTPVGGPQPSMATLAQQLGAVAQARAATQDDPLAARLRKLDELRAAGLISDAEHDARTLEILDEV